jgi:FkbM family methyltransferase
MAQEARIVRLDDFGTDPIFFLKIDTEGYEQHVLRGAANLLRNSTARPVHIMMEFSPGLQVRRAYT